MSTECTHDCANCSQHCGSSEDRKSLLATPNPGSRIGKIIGVASGKGGVGKSYVTTMLAVAMAKRGYRVAILDADATGPSIPKAFGLHTGIIEGNAAGSMIPATTVGGIKVMSVNLLVQEEEAPVVWRGPVIAGVVTQFYTDVDWGEVDFMFVDMPPGTGDVPLTVFQSLPLNGIVLVTSPQDLVSLIVKKALNMANMMQIPVLGLVENFSYFQCPSCNEKHRLFGDSRIEAIAAENHTRVLAELPIDPSVTALVDSGRAEEADTARFDLAVESILAAE